MDRHTEKLTGQPNVVWNMPDKKQMDAVNDYLRSVHADGDGRMSMNNIAYRKIASHDITINAIRVLDSE